MPRTLVLVRWLPNGAGTSVLMDTGLSVFFLNLFLQKLTSPLYHLNPRFLPFLHVFPFNSAVQTFLVVHGECISKGVEALGIPRPHNHRWSLRPDLPSTSRMLLIALVLWASSSALLLLFSDFQKDTNKFDSPKRTCWDAGLFEWPIAVFLPSRIPHAPNHVAHS